MKVSCYDMTGVWGGGVLNRGFEHSSISDAVEGVGAIGLAE